MTQGAERWLLFQQIRLEDLPLEVKPKKIEAALLEKLERFGKVSLALKFDRETGEFLGHGIAKYRKCRQAVRAVEGLQGLEIFGHRVRVKAVGERVLAVRAGAEARAVFVGWITPSLMRLEALAALRSLCEPFGECESIALAPRARWGNRNPRHRCWGYVTMKTEAAARALIEQLDGHELVDTKLQVRVFDPSMVEPPYYYEPPEEAVLDEATMEPAQSAEPPPLPAPAFKAKPPSKARPPKPKASKPRSRRNPAVGIVVEHIRRSGS